LVDHSLPPAANGMQDIIIIGDPESLTYGLLVKNFHGKALHCMTVA